MSRPLQPDWDAEITLREAATISGLSYSHLRDRAADGALRTVKKGERLNMTTRRWLDDYLRARGTRGGGRGPAPKLLPTDYQTPPRRGRPLKATARPLPTDEERMMPVTDGQRRGVRDAQPGGSGECDDRCSAGGWGVDPAAPEPL